MRSSAPADDSSGAASALTRTLERLLAPIARLCLARGLRFTMVKELMKRAFVDAARAAQSEGGSSRDISRVSAATGLTRRDVTRITDEARAPSVGQPSPPLQVFTRWMGNRRLHDKSGQPLLLKRQGRAPSFEALALSVTRDLHPRSLLDELCRLGLAEFDEASDTVRLIRDSFAPHEDQERQLGFLGSNVGDHMDAAVTNVLASRPPHLEQAIYADEFSDESLGEVRKLVNAQWKAMLRSLVPELQALIDADQKAGRPARNRVRIGLYSYHAKMPATSDESTDA